MDSSAGVIRRLSEDVVNRIAAGEVIHRPFNVVKELMENCIDAGASSIQIIVKNGGTKSIQIIDNGTGIRSDDLSIVCERFTTSKLKKLDDLWSMRTYGFRGEALSSISHASHVTIITKVENEECGHKVMFIDGKPKTAPSNIAANRGTTILVEDLFYNMPVRRKTMKSDSEEFNVIADVVTKYAVHNSNKIGFILKKHGEMQSYISTKPGTAINDVIKSIFGVNIADNLLEISYYNEQKSKYSFTGFVSNSNVLLKKFNFILFINERLVDCSALKKSIDNVYAKCLTKGNHPFVYLNIKIQLNRIDINVHPTKSEVKFLDEEEVCAMITDIIEAKISSGEYSKNFISQKSLPNTSFEVKYDSIASGESNSEQIKSFANIIKVPAKKKLKANKELNADINVTPKVIKSQPNYTKPQNHIRTDSTERKIDELFSPNYKRLESGRREIRLSTVLSLRKSVGEMCDKNLQQLICKSSYVGCANEKFLIIQHETQLMMVNIENVNRELFYQYYLIDFGNFGIIKFSSPLKISELIKIYLEVHTDKVESIIPDDIEKLLISKNIMLNDYFSMKITQNGELITIPIIIESHTPNLSFLPQFMCSLVNDVDWNTEKGCFDSVGRVLAEFYAKPPNKFDNDDDFNKWKKFMELVLYPAYKAVLCPSKRLANELTFRVSANLNDLYKVFERC